MTSGGDRPGEFDLIARVRGLLPDVGQRVAIGPGDDCAAVGPSEGRLLLITVDALVEDRHFLRRDTTPAAVGRRLAAVNLSDVAAMGGEPRWAVLSLAVPEEIAGSWIPGVSAGVARTLADHGTAVVGGNVSGSASAVFADLTLIGDVEPDRVLRRSGARPGDVVLVTGRLGDAAAGARLAARTLELPAELHAPLLAAHRTPRPRLREGRALALHGGATAAIDVSDGLAGDALHVATASDVDLEIRVDRLPVGEAFLEAARIAGEDARPWAASGGEDYELLFTADPAAVDDLARHVARLGGAAITVIGRALGRSGDVPVVRFVDAAGREVDVPARSWDHFGRSPS